MYNRKYISVEGNELLKRAQAGDEHALNDLIELIRVQIMPRRVGRYLGRNRQVDNDDIKQEFMIGVALAVGKAQLDMGDPIEFLINSGLYRVKSYMRKHIIQGTMQICDDCGHKSRINKVGFNTYQCRKCGGHNISTYEVNDYDEITLSNMHDMGFEEDTLSELMIEQFKSTLQPGTNVYRLLELLESGVDRYNPLVKNYVKEIARMWGGCSTENVMQNMRKLRSRMAKWMDEQGVEITIDMSEVDDNANVGRR